MDELVVDENGCTEVQRDQMVMELMITMITAQIILMKTKQGLSIKMDALQIVIKMELLM